MSYTCAIIQARTGSTRLPFKVLKPLVGNSILGHVIRRVSASKEIDRIIVATSTLPQDDVVEQEALKHGALVYRGSETDVLSRYADAAREFDADTVIRITSDCPLIDAEVIDEIIRLFRASGADYASNVVERTYPRGMDAEVFSAQLLQEVNATATESFEREHVTVRIYRNPDIYKLTHHRYEHDYSSYRWTLDTPEDWDFIKEVYERLYTPDALFSWQEALSLMKSHPELAQINAHVEQKPV
jgi:spore coat polysaccharide biosynthesis protein SpsF